MRNNKLLIFFKKIDTINLIDEITTYYKTNKDRLEEIILRTKKGGAEIVKFLEKGF